MRILTVHSRYAQRGGEDALREAERDLLRAHGHEVSEYVRNNDEIQDQPAWNVATRTIWSRPDYLGVRQQIRQDRTEIVAVHNFFPLISPSVYYAAHAEGVPVVQTLHNYRLICPGAFLLRDGRLCSDCVGKSFQYPGVIHGCYRGSKALSAVIATMSATHRLMGTWKREVDRFIALTPFMRDRFVEAGFPAGKLVVKPNFTADTGAGNGEDGHFIFVGRLSPEKGVGTLLRAWKLCAGSISPSRELRIVGTGPEEMNLRAQAVDLPNVRFLGHLSPAEVQHQLGSAAALIVPSLWHEAFGLTVIEALAKGTPVIASNVGALSSLVTDGYNGALFERDDAPALAEILLNWRSDPAQREAARASYLAQYTPDKNYEQLISIYTATIDEFKNRRGAAVATSR